jgi:hypothetical protein
MEVVKRNLFSIISGAVALLAMLLAYYPLSGWFDQLSTRLKQSSAAYNDLNAVINASHHMPNLTLEPAETEPLKTFPSVKMIQQGVELVAELKGQSEKLSEIVMKMNAHVPLVPQVFPTGGAGQHKNQFKFAYYKRVADLRQALNATSPPTLTELKVVMEKLRAEAYEKKLVTVGGRDNKSEIDSDLRATELMLPERECQNRAKQFTMYASLKTMDPCIREGYMPAKDDQFYPYDAESMWAAQTSLWIEEDIVKAIIATNAKAKGPGVENAIVKRILKLDIPKKYITAKGEVTFSMPRFAGGGGPGAGAAAWKMPEPAAAEVGEPESPNTRIYVASATGRICNSLYDVMHFTLVADCDAAHFRELMANLMTDRFITVVRTDLIGLDRDKEVNRGFLYGKDPVVRVAMRCEAIMFRDWTKRWMPPSVKKLLKVPDEPAAASN